MTTIHGAKLAPATAQEIETAIGGHGVISTSPLKISKTSNAVFSEGVTRSGRKYARRLSVEAQGMEPISFWVEQNASSSKRLSMVDELDAETNVSSIESFEFEVVHQKTRATKRNQSQNQIKNGSAREYLRSQGFKVDDVDVDVDFHWAHRQACIFGGSQSSKNLDATTSVSNYETYQCVEKPVHHLVASGKVKSLHVKGRVHLISDKTHVPNILEMFLSRNGVKVRVVTDPLGTEKPSSAQKKMMTGLIEHSFTGLEQSRLKK